MKSIHQHLLALLATAAFVVPGTTGCMFIELNGGAYPIHSYSPPDGKPDPANKPGGIWGVGAALGVYLDVAKKVRVAPGVGVEYMPVSDSGGGSGSFLRSGFAGQVDYSVVDMDDDHKIRATLAVLIGSSKGKYNGAEDSGKTLSVFGGATYAMFSSDQDSVGLSLGPHYVHNSGDTIGSYTAIGLQLKLTVSANLASGGGSSGGGSSDDSGVAGIEFDLPNDSNIIPALANAARRTGCDVDEKSDGLIAKCSPGNIVYIQKGQKLVALCQRGLSNADCRSLHSQILGNAEVK